MLMISVYGPLGRAVAWAAPQRQVTPRHISVLDFSLGGNDSAFRGVAASRFFEEGRSS
jgi:hypothetical protein